MNNRHALLVAPRLIERTYPGKPMALDYLAAALQHIGWRISIIDVDIESEEKLTTTLQKNRFDLIGITAMSIQIDEANKLACLARELSPDSILIRGGAHDTHSYKESCSTDQNLYDAFVVGEGEETIQEIAVQVEKDSFLENRQNIKGIAFWNDSVQFTGYRHSTIINNYIPLRLSHHSSYNFDVLRGRKTAQVVATRGCSNACFYCSESVSLYGRREIRRTIEHLRQEFAWLKQHGYEAIYFDDPTFTRDKNWVFKLCEELKRWGFIWGCNTRVDCLDEETVRGMRQAGCEYLFCGFESAVPEILQAMNKTSDPSKYLEDAVSSYSVLRKNGLPCSAFLIFGNPRREKKDKKLIYAPETDKDVYNSLDFAINTLDPDYLSMNILRLLPGLPYSFAPQFSCLRPTGDDPIHGGHYDGTWYSQNNQSDLRSTHQIYRAFEGRASVNPPQMTPKRCCEILSLAIELVNQKNSKKEKTQTIIVVDPKFSPFLKENWQRGYRRYEFTCPS